MNKLFKTLSLLAVLMFFAAACTPAIVNVAQAAPAEVTAPKSVTYQAVLGKSLNDKDVANFVASNKCSSAVQFQLCRSVGMALWLDSDQKVQNVFLYPGDSNGFSAYQGQLPLGLMLTDTMEMVEQKLGYPIEIHAPQAGWISRLPDQGISPDHFHYLATYTSFGLTIAYNSPSADDKGATIHAIIVENTGKPK